MANEHAFEIGSIRFTAIRRQAPSPHWVFRTDENGITYDPGTGGISHVSIPKMKADIQKLLDLISHGDIADFRRRFALPEQAPVHQSAGTQDQLIKTQFEVVDDGAPACLFGVPHG